jgi:hypothetical protein
MPLRKQGTLVRSALGLAAVAAFAVAAPAAQAACVQAPTTKAFSKVGDQADYSPAPGGTFEGTHGWTLGGGAKIVTGNETVGITTGSKSLSMPAGSTAKSPEFCVDETNPYFRFVAKPTGSMAGYQAIVLYKNSSGQVTEAQFTSSKDVSWADGKWSASAVQPLAVKIPLVSGATASVQIYLKSTGNQLAVGIGLWGKLTSNTGTTQFDSVMVDPYRRG